MSSKEPESNDFMKLAIAGGIGVFTLAAYIIYVCFKCDNKKEEMKQEVIKGEKNEEKKEIIKQKENNINNDKEEKVEEKKEQKEENEIKTNNKKKRNKNKNKNKEKKNIKEENKNMDFVVDDDRDGEWETIGEKKDTEKLKEQREEEKKKILI